MLNEQKTPNFDSFTPFVPSQPKGLSTDRLSLSEFRNSNCLNLLKLNYNNIAYVIYLNYFKI